MKIAWSTTPPTALARVAVAETERIVAWLRLPALGLIAAGQALPPSPGTETDAFTAVIGVYGAWALASLVRVHIAPASTRFALVSVGVDVVAITVLAALSGGPFSQARLAYFLIPAAVAFRFRPGLTAAAGAAVVVAYLAQGFANPGSGPEDAGRFILVQSGYLAWFSTASVLGAVLLARRTRSVSALAEQRGVLLADALDAEERERRRLSEGLHDSSIQNLLSARHAIQEAQAGSADDSARPAGAALAQADESIAATVDELRDAIFELHPYVLEQAGLGSALTAVGRRAAERGGFQLDLEIASIERTQADRVLLAATQELLANIDAHAAADRVRIQLRRTDEQVVLRVVDDGAGFDTTILPSRLAAGHIGLASQRTRVEAVGGSFEVQSAPGQGTEVTISIPLDSPPDAGVSPVRSSDRTIAD